MLLLGEPLALRAGERCEVSWDEPRGEHGHAILATARRSEAVNSRAQHRRARTC